MVEIPESAFLLSVLKHNKTKVNCRQLAAALDLSIGATNMRLVRLRRKLAGNQTTVTPTELEFVQRVLEFSGGKTDNKAVANELGLKEGAVNMRLVRLRKKYGVRGNTGDDQMDREIKPKCDEK
jgi:DNA-binding CsgD family transcriptional regulator